MFGQVVEEKGALRRVRTPAGVRRYKQPVGSIILRDVALTHMILGDSPWEGWEVVERVDPGKGKSRRTGEYYSLGRDEETGKWIATDASKPDDWTPIVEADTEADLYWQLNEHFGGAQKKPRKAPTPAANDTPKRPGKYARDEIGMEIGTWGNTLTDDGSPLAGDFGSIADNYDDGQIPNAELDERATRALLRRLLNDHPEATDEEAGIVQAAIDVLNTQGKLRKRDTYESDEEYLKTFLGGKYARSGSAPKAVPEDKPSADSTRAAETATGAPEPISDAPGDLDPIVGVKRVESDYEGWEQFEDIEGDIIYFGRAEDDGRWYATGPGEWDEVWAEGDTPEEAWEELRGWYVEEEPVDNTPAIREELAKGHSLEQFKKALGKYDRADLMAAADSLGVEYPKNSTKASLLKRLFLHSRSEGPITVKPAESAPDEPEADDLAELEGVRARNVPSTPAGVIATRGRQGKIDVSRNRAELLARIEELVLNDPSRVDEHDEFLIRKSAEWRARYGDDPEMEDLLSMADTGDMRATVSLMERMAAEWGLARIGLEPGEKYDRAKHKVIGGRGPLKGEEIDLVRPGFIADIDGEEIVLLKADVEIVNTLEDANREKLVAELNRQYAGLGNWERGGDGAFSRRFDEYRITATITPDDNGYQIELYPGRVQAGRTTTPEAALEKAESAVRQEWARRSAPDASVEKVPVTEPAPAKPKPFAKTLDALLANVTAGEGIPSQHSAFYLNAKAASLMGGMNDPDIVAQAFMEYARELEGIDDPDALRASRIYRRLGEQLDRSDRPVPGDATDLVSAAKRQGWIPQLLHSELGTEEVVKLGLLHPDTKDFIRLTWTRDGSNHRLVAATVTSGDKENLAIPLKSALARVRRALSGEEEEVPDTDQAKLEKARARVALIERSTPYANVLAEALRVQGVVDQSANPTRASSVVQLRRAIRQALVTYGVTGDDEKVVQAALKLKTNDEILNHLRLYGLGLGLMPIGVVGTEAGFDANLHEQRNGTASFRPGEKVVFDKPGVLYRMGAEDLPILKARVNSTRTPSEGETNSAENVEYVRSGYIGAMREAAEEIKLSDPTTADVLMYMADKIDSRPLSETAEELEEMASAYDQGSDRAKKAMRRLKDEIFNVRMSSRGVPTTVAEATIPSSNTPEIEMRWRSTRIRNAQGKVNAVYPHLANRIAALHDRLVAGESLDVILAELRSYKNSGSLGVDKAIDQVIRELSGPVPKFKDMWFELIETKGLTSVHQAKRKGAMVALIPRQEDIDRLHVPGGEPKEDMHLTLFYLGNGDDYNQTERALIIGEIRDELRYWVRRMQGNGFAINLFNPKGEEPCLVMGVGGDELDSVHGAVVRRLYQVGSAKPGTDHGLVGSSDIPYKYPRQHTPWIPHITLSYYPEGELPNPAEFADKTGPVEFDRIRIVFSGETTDIPLTLSNEELTELLHRVTDVKAVVVTPGGRIGNNRRRGSQSNGKNWVERSKAGELPEYIRIVRNGLMKEGHSESRATALAVAAIKRWARGGDNVSEKVQAAAVKALAQWEAMKAGKSLLRSLSLVYGR